MVHPEMRGEQWDGVNDRKMSNSVARSMTERFFLMISFSKRASINTEESLC